MLQRSFLTPTRTDIGRRVLYVPENRECVLTDLHQIFAKIKFPKGERALCDVRNLKLIKEQKKSKRS